MDKLPSQFWVFYGNGEVYEGSSDYDAFFTPATDVQVILQRNPDDPEKLTLVFGKAIYGWYCWREGHWFITDEAGYNDYMMNIPGPKKVLYGRSMLKTADFNAILQKAKELRATIYGAQN